MSKHGLPDFGLDIARSRNLAGYYLVPGEYHKWMYIMAVPDPGELVGTREAIDPGEEVALVDAEDGAGYLYAPSGYDWLVKAVYTNFTEPVQFRMKSDYVDDYICFSTYDMYREPLDTWLIGWVRTFIEPIDTPSKNYFYYKNIGDSPMYGKAWIIAFMKDSAYTWV